MKTLEEISRLLSSKEVDNREKQRRKQIGTWKGDYKEQKFHRIDFGNLTSYGINGDLTVDSGTSWLVNGEAPHERYKWKLMGYASRHLNHAVKTGEFDKALVGLQVYQALKQTDRPSVQRRIVGAFEKAMEVGYTALTTEKHINYLKSLLGK